MRVVITDKDTQVFAENSEKAKPNYTVPTKDFYEGILAVSDPWIATGVLPPRVVWMSDDHSAVIFERFPFQMSMYYHYGTAGQGKKYEATEYDISLPWTVYGLLFDKDTGHVDDLRIFARNTAITSFDDPLFSLPIPNMQYTAAACLGDEYMSHYDEPFRKRLDLAAKAGEPCDITLAERISHAINTFWSGVFNMDIPSWASLDRLPLSMPDAIKGNGDDATRAVQVLEWLAKLNRTEAAAVNYARSNVFGVDENGDTLAHLRDRLELAGVKERRAIPQGHRLTTRALHKMPGVQVVPMMMTNPLKNKIDDNF